MVKSFLIIIYHLLFSNILASALLCKFVEQKCYVCMYVLSGGRNVRRRQPSTKYRRGSKKFFQGFIYFWGLTTFCVLRELSFAIGTDFFFWLGINFCDFQNWSTQYPALIIFSFSTTATAQRTATYIGDHKNQHFQIPIRSKTHGHVSTSS